MTPASTYRLQIRAAFDLNAAAEQIDYLRALGVGWAYLSPVLQATTGSDHGYDVTDPTRVDAARGGPEGLRVFADAAHSAGLGVLIDIVPNHQGVAAARENPWWWDVLLRAQESAHAGAFDIDWDFGGGAVVIPQLGAELDDALAAGEITIDPTPEDDAPWGTAQYYDNVLPLAEGTAPSARTSEAEAVRAVLERQHWRWVFWKREAETLNYRRFFTITTLAGVRVEVPEVFAATHTEVLRWFAEGIADGLRIDHPDGLADPGGYVARLDAALRAAGASEPFVVVEKILEAGEQLPGWWATAGTTGYDALAEIDRVLTDGAGQAGLDAIDATLRGADALGYDDLVAETKRAVVAEGQQAELRRLVRLLPEPLRSDAAASEALTELLVAFPVYRAYLPAGAEHLAHAVEVASARRPDLTATLQSVTELVGDPASELSRRFMQTTGPVMAKGVEDAAFYRFTRLGSLTEVGGDPSVFSLDVRSFHEAFSRRQAAWPRAMTALSTHDTKRSEDVRARLAVLAEIPERWAEVLEQLRAIAATPDGGFDGLLWQAIIGAWPATPERLQEYATKAAREAGTHTSWAAPDEEFEAAAAAVVDAAFGDARPVVEQFVAEVADAGWSNALAAKLLQLAGPGVPDVYQGSELWDLSLVDPDNRRLVDYGIRRDLLARIDGGWMPGLDASGAVKLLVVSRALRARRDRPQLFTRYVPATVVGEASAHAVAFDRGGAIAVATRLPVGLAARGGWGQTELLLGDPVARGDAAVPAGAVYRDAFTGRLFDAGRVRVSDVLADYPVALLLREETP